MKLGIGYLSEAVELTVDLLKRMDCPEGSESISA